MKSSSSTCLLLSVLFGVISTKSFQIQYHDDFSSSIFKMFTVLAPKLRSLAHFQLISAYGVRWGSKLTLWHVWHQFSQHHVKGLFPLRDCFGSCWEFSHCFLVSSRSWASGLSDPPVSNTWILLLHQRGHRLPLWKRKVLFNVVFHGFPYMSRFLIYFISNLGMLCG